MNSNLEDQFVYAESKQHSVVCFRPGHASVCLLFGKNCAELFHDPLDAFVELHWDLEIRVRVDIEPALWLAEVDFVVKLTSHDLFVLVSFEPLDAFSLFPEAELCGRARHDVSAEAVLFASAPVARVGASI